MKNTQKYLLDAIGDLPLISVSFKPMDFGKNICYGEHERSAYNIYKQVLIGAKAATTEYVATAEDDVIYPKEHFEYRPPKDVFAFDENKWSIFTWRKDAIASFRRRRTMTHLIVSREALIKTLEERFAKYPDPKNIPESIFGEPGRFEAHLGITPLINERYLCPIPSVVFCTEEALAFSSYLGVRKAHSREQTTDIPYWGSVKNLLKLYKI